MKKILAALILVGLCLAMCSNAMAQSVRVNVQGYRPVHPAYVAPAPRYYRPVPPPPPRYYRPAPPPPPAPVYAPRYYYPRRGGVNVNVPGVGVHVGW